MCLLHFLQMFCWSAKLFKPQFKKKLNETGRSRNAKPSLEQDAFNAFCSCFAGTREVCLCLIGLGKSERHQGLRLSDTMVE